MEDIVLAPLIGCLSTIMDCDGPYLWYNTLLWYNGKLAVPVSNELLALILHKFHVALEGGHSEFEWTYFHLSC